MAYTSRMVFPKGSSEISINLKCCLAKGIPNDIPAGFPERPLFVIAHAMKTPPVRISGANANIGGECLVMT
jgi:hypothetical protein